MGRGRRPHPPRPQARRIRTGGRLPRHPGAREHQRPHRRQPATWTTAEARKDLPRGHVHPAPRRCAQIRRALSRRPHWSDNGQYHYPQFLTYTVTDSHGRTWRIHPATNFQISLQLPSRSGRPAAPR
ncbi:hypothetical protein LV779_22040 [Streptomyces thinghirensis]|nr:hypothetical protein [Streptomyces thinghirensis]